jgi:hypothetical protein
MIAVRILIGVFCMSLVGFVAYGQSPSRKPIQWESTEFADVLLTLGMSKAEALEKLMASSKLGIVKTTLPSDEYSIATRADGAKGEYLGSVTFQGNSVDRIEESEGGTLLFLPTAGSPNDDPRAQAIVAFKALYNAVKELQTQACYLSTKEDANTEQAHVVINARCGREDIDVSLTTFEDGAKGVSVLRRLTRR